MADALLAGEADTMTTNEQRKAEKEALISARRELSLRIATMEAERREVQQSAKQKVAQALEPLSAMVIERTRKRASDFAESFAELKAVTVASGGNLNAVEAAREAIVALRLDQTLLSRERRDVDVPEHILAALAPLQDAGPALPGSRYPMRHTIEI